MTMIDSSDAEKQFPEFDEAGFTDWLERGFRSLYASGDSFGEPFAPVWSLINKRDSISEDLAHVYRQFIPSSRRTAFHRAIGQTLSQFGASLSFPEQAVKDLIYLVGKTGAKDALYSFSGLLHDRREGKPADWLQFECIAQVKQLLPDERAVKALYEIIHLSNFDFRFSFDVLTALIISVPDRWMNHLKVLNESLISLYQMARTEDAADDFYQASTRLWHFVARHVSPDKIVRQLTASEMYWYSDERFSGARMVLDKLLSPRDSPITIAGRLLVRDKTEVLCRLECALKTRPSSFVFVESFGENAAYRDIFSSFKIDGTYWNYAGKQMTPEQRRAIEQGVLHISGKGETPYGGSKLSDFD